MTDQTPAEIDRFHACLPLTLAQECPLPNEWSSLHNFSDDPHDPGGATMCGITQGEYDIYRKSKGAPVQSVKLLTEIEGEDIYDLNYWLPYCPLLPPGLDLEFFDSSVNEGTHEAIKILQTVLDITSDGNWGPQTALAVKGIVNVTVTVKAFTARRSVVYKETRGDRYFDTDWQRRDQQIGAAALKMVTK